MSSFFYSNKQWIKLNIIITKRWIQISTYDNCRTDSSKRNSLEDAPMRILHFPWRASFWLENLRTTHQSFLSQHESSYYDPYSQYFTYIFHLVFGLCPRTSSPWDALATLDGSRSQTWKVKTFKILHKKLIQSFLSKIFWNLNEIKWNVDDFF